MAKFLDFRASQPVRLPNGRMATISYINHPGAVVILPQVGKDQMVLLRQFRPALGKYIVELPAGTLDPKETLAACAKRELIEETGYRAGKIQKLGQVYPVPGYSTEIIYVFLATQLKEGPAAREPDEVIEQRVVSRSQIKKLFHAGRLVDAKSICALAFHGWL